MNNCIDVHADLQDDKLYQFVLLLLLFLSMPCLFYTDRERVTRRNGWAVLYVLIISSLETSWLLRSLERKAKKEMKRLKKTEHESSTHEKRISDLSDPEEIVVPSIAALIGILLTGLLYFVLPPSVILGPNWLLLVMQAVFVVPLIIDFLTPWDFSQKTRRTLVLVPLGLGTVALMVGVVLFILTLPTDRNAINLLRAAALLWVFNFLVFALWYWELDGGGPLKRHLSGHHAADFLFPQQANGQSWEPHFFDYLFVAFTGATAFSPTDTLPLTKTAKALMMMEAVLSFTVIGLLAARAVNIL